MALDVGVPTARARFFSTAGVVLLTAWLGFGVIREAHGLGDRLSPVADPYSESNAIRGALAYLSNGFTAHASLPETTYGGVHPEEGDLRWRMGAKHVDTHYPPGPTWLAAAMMTVCESRGPLSCLRILPILVGTVGALALGFALVASLGPLCGLVATFAAFSIPLYGNMMLGLHYQGYALALLSVQLAALLRAFAAGRSLKRRDLLLGGSLGFLQGWLSFDYFFLVAFAAVPIAVLFADLREPGPRRLLLGWMAAATAGFVLAHALHFLQVVAYYGSLGAALDDLGGVAVERADPTQPASGPPRWVGHPWMISSVYLFLLSARPRHFNFSLGNMLVPVLVVLFALRGMTFRLPGTAVRLVADRSTRPAWAALAAVLVSCMWIAVMAGHAFTHQNFIPRHLFLAWLVTVMALLCAFRLERVPSTAA